MKTASQEIAPPTQNLSPFAGFEIPESNFFMMPREWLKIRAKYARFPSMVFCVEYILAHTWGWTYRDEDGHIVHAQKIRLTRDDFVNGRKKKDGSRYDNGTGLSESSVVNGLDMAEKEGFIEVEIDDSDRGRIKKTYSLKMKASQIASSKTEDLNSDKRQEEETARMHENEAALVQNESREDAQVTDTSRGLTVTPLTVDPQGSNDYPSYKRVNNSSKKFKTSMIEGKEVVNGNGGGKANTPSAKKLQPAAIINYAALTPDEKMQVLAAKTQETAKPGKGTLETWKERLDELKRQVEEQKKQAAREPQRAKIEMKDVGADSLPTSIKIASQIENKTLVEALENEIADLEKLLDSLKVLALDVGNKLGDTQHPNKNIRHMTNDYRIAAKKGKTFSEFMDEVYYVCKYVLARGNVKNKGAYFWIALEEKLGLRQMEYELSR
ncbi:MAG: hypothetical protein ACYDER_01200 [Ktedonobacteraceae bacterium]